MTRSHVSGARIQTVYNYGYLWTVHSLYWWYRDEGNVTQVAFECVLYEHRQSLRTRSSLKAATTTYYQWAQKLAELDRASAPSKNA